jgi:hypothetical protein
VFRDHCGAVTCIGRGRNATIGTGDVRGEMRPLFTDRPAHSPQGLRPTEGPHGSEFSMVPPTGTSRPGDWDTTGGAFGRQSSQPENDKALASTRVGGGVRISAYISGPKCAERTVAATRESLEKLLQTYLNEPKRFWVKPHETMSHLCL